MKKIGVFIFIATIMFACNREEPTTWTVDVAIPIAHAHLSMQDLVPDSLLEADENGLWHLVIRESITDFDLDSIVAIPDTTIHKGFTPAFSGGPFPIPPGQDLITQSVNTELALNDVELKEVLVKSGSMQYAVKSYTGAYLDCVYSLPGVTLNGIPVVIYADTDPGTDANPFVEGGVIDLAGYEIDLSGTNGNLSNTVASTVTISISEDQPGDAMIFGDDSVAIELHFVEPRVSYARGYFGQHEYTLDESTSFSEDFDMPEGTLNLDQVHLNLSIENYTGTDARIDFEELSAVNNNTMSTIILQNDLIYQPINITRAFDNNGTVEPVTEEFILDNSNSNIDEFVEILPDSLHLVGEVTVNPLGDVSDGNDFIYTDQALNAVMELDIPLCVGMEGLLLRDTLEISSSLEVDINGKIYLDIVNAFPFSTTLDLILVNQDGELITSLMNDGIVAAGGIVPVHSTLTILIDEGVAAFINPSNRFVLSITFDTPSLDEVVKIYENHYMDVKIRAEAEIGVEVD